MDWDLWESSYDQDTLEESDYMQSGWNRDFFGHGYDVIEENALNEKSCIQVLRILIAKQDMEIDTLEQNLSSLQTELACTELEEWPEICCSLLREKINDIDATVRSLKNKSDNVSELQLSMPKESAEKIEDILKAVLRKHLLEKDKQPPEAISLDVKSDASENAIEHFESLEKRQLESDIIVKVEPGEIVSSAEMCSEANSSPDHQERKTNYPSVTKPAPTNTMDPSLVCLRLITGSSGKTKNSIMTDSNEATRQFEVIEHKPISDDEKIIQSKPLNHGEDRSLGPAEYDIKTSSASSFKFSKDCVNVVKSLCRLDVKANQRMEVNMASPQQDSTSTKDLHPEGDRASERISEAQNAIVEYISLDDFVQTAIVNARNPISESKLRTSRPTDGGERDLDKKLVELKRKTTRKEGIRKLKIENATITAEQGWELQVDPQKPTVADFYKSDLNLGPKLQNLMAKRKVDESYRADFKSPHFDFHNLKPQSPTGKKKSQPDSKSIKQQGVLPTKRKYNTSSQSANKRPKSDTSKDNACLNEVLVKEPISKKLAPPEDFTKEHDTSLAIIEHPLQHATKELSVELKFPEPLEHGSNGDSAGNTPKALSLVSLRSDGSDLNKMKVDVLKAVAKEMKLSGFSKLKKSELIEIIKAKREEMSKL